MARTRRGGHALAEWNPRNRHAHHHVPDVLPAGPGRMQREAQRHHHPPQQRERCRYAFQQDHAARFQGKFAAFRTTLNVIEEFKK